MTRQVDLAGKIVSEEEVAVDLGFASVHEMRRWDTEQGQRVADLEAKLREVESDRDRFLWAGRLMEAVLRRIPEPPKEQWKLRLAINVVLGEAVDWGNELRDWWPNDKTETNI